MPCRLGDLGVPVGQRVRLRRRFGYPGRIDPHERVWLTFAGMAGAVDVSLNGQHLGRSDGASFEFEVTPLLKDRNTLELILEAPEGDQETWQEVALEIRCTET